MQLHPYGTLAISCAAAASVEAALHWFPWNRIVSRRQRDGLVPPLLDRETGELAPPYTYIGGLLPILISYCTWLLCGPETPDPIAAVGILAITGTAGVTVFASYVIDRKFANIWHARLGGLDGTKGRRSTS